MAQTSSAPTTSARSPLPHTRKFSGKTVVITGASSGIGRLTALAFAREGANLGLIARSHDGLSTLAAEIRDLGGRSFVFPIDVADAGAMRHAASEIAREFGGIDIWINNAGTAVYAEAKNTSLEDLHRVMDVNFYGQVHAVLAALPFLEKSKGQIIGIGSVESEIGIPLHSAYSASKHALYGYYKVLQEELLHDKSPVRVSVILPSSIATPFFEHAKTQMGVRPKPLGRVYHPQRVVDAILSVTEKPRFSVIVGGAGKDSISFFRHSPKAFFWLQSKLGFRLQKTKQPKRGSDRNNLYQPVPNSSRVIGADKPSSLAEFWEDRGGQVIAGALACGVAALIFVARHRLRGENDQPVRRATDFPPAATGDELDMEMA